MLGQWSEASNSLTEAERLIEATDGRQPEAELHLARANLAACTDDQSAAEVSSRRALAIARAQDAKLYELRAATHLAAMLHKRGKGAEARALLAPIYGWFTEGFDAPDLKDAKALLDELA